MMKKELSIKELEANVRKHNRLYFVDHKPIISDYEFDRLVEELKRRKPNSKVLTELVSDAPPTGAKVVHDIPMLSLDKCYDEKTINDWAEKFEDTVIASPKIDGCAVSIKYSKDGQLVQAATRGDGNLGEDITANVHYIKDIPQMISLKHVEVRGEIFMKLSVFKKYKNQFANPRNLAAGAIKQKDPHKTGEYNLSFLAYDLLNASLTTEEQKRKALEKEKIPVAPWHLISKNKMQKTFEDLLSKHDRDDFETDGVVFKVNSVSEQERLGITAHHPRFAIAYKFQGESGVTKLLDIEWSVARTGVITPVAVVLPVELSGVTVVHASLHNIGIMKKLGITHGAEVLMMRRGGVIPNIESVVKAGKGTIEIPKRCPSCGAVTELRDDFLYCTNAKSCVKSKVASLLHFISEIGCDGFGEKLVAKLYETGFVTDAADFYTLATDNLLQFERMGDILAAKLINAIGETKKMPIDIFLRSLGIRELGKHTSAILAKHGNIKKIMGLTEEELSEIHTIGPVIAHEVAQGLKNKKDLIEKLLKHVTLTYKAADTAQGPLAGKKFLFTGSMLSMERKAAQDMVEKAGGEAAIGVSKELDYLVVGDGGGAGSKLDKAKKIIADGGKTRIISEKEFLKMLKNP